jgi:hypothetical protein
MMDMVFPPDFIVRFFAMGECYRERSAADKSGGDLPFIVASSRSRAGDCWIGRGADRGIRIAGGVQTLPLHRVS